MKITPIDTRTRSGSFAGMTAVTIGDTVYYRSKPPKRGPDAKMTYNQRRSQAQYATCMQAYRALEPLIRFSLMRTSPAQRVNALFLKYNKRLTQALLTKEELRQGWQLLDNYVVSTGDGTLPSIEFVQQGEKHVSGLELSQLEITPETTVRDFINALLSRDNGLEEGDALTFVMCRQVRSFDDEMQVIELTQSTLPVVRQYAPQGEARLLEVLAPIPLSTTLLGNHCLLSLPAEEGLMVTIIHSRRMRDRYLNSSEQRLVGSNPALEPFLTQERLDEAVFSYGPVKQPSLFNPSVPLPSDPKPGFTLADFMREQNESPK